MSSTHLRKDLMAERYMMVSMKTPLIFHIQPVGLPWLWNGWRIKDSESRKIRKQLLY